MANTVIGAGRLYVARLDADDNPLAERYLGDSVGASLAGGEGDRIQVFAGDGADSSRKLVDKLLDVTRSMTLTLRDISFGNLALFVMGEEKESGAVAAVAKGTPEQFPACKAGDEFQLGTYVAAAPGLGYPSIQAAAAARKIGYKAGNSGAAEDDAAGVAKVLFEPVMADYIEKDFDGDGARTSAAKDGAGGDTANSPEIVVFGDTGRVRALKDLADGFRLSYTPVASFDYVESSTEPVEGAVRYVEYDPRNGTGRTVYMEKATIRPNGEWPLKTRGQEQQLPLTCESLGKVYVGDGVAE